MIAHFRLLIFLLPLILLAATACSSLGPVEPLNNRARIAALEWSRLKSDHDRAQKMAYGGSADQQIVGGVPVAPGDSASESVVLLLITRGSSLHVCSSVLVARQALLTAAHCVAGAELRKIRVAFRAPDVSAADPVQDQYPSRVVIHEKYDGKPENKYDLAILFLSQTPPRSQIPIQILAPSEKVEGDDVLLVGFGITSELKRDSMTLRKTKKSWSKEIHMKGNYFGITQSSPSGGFCRGDSGAPVIVAVSGGEKRLLGINSFTIGLEPNRECHTASVAMSAPHFKSWIEGHVAQR